jgi:hypothetical protein
MGLPTGVFQEQISGVLWARSIASIDGVDWQPPFGVQINPVEAKLTPRPADLDYDPRPSSVRWGLGEDIDDTERRVESPCDKALDSAYGARTLEEIVAATVKGLMSPGALIDYIRVPLQANFWLDNLGNATEERRLIASASVALVRAQPELLMTAAKQDYEDRAVETLHRPFQIIARLALEDGLVKEAARLEEEAENLIGQWIGPGGGPARATLASLQEIETDRTS